MLARRGALALVCIVLASLAFRLHVSRECSLWLDEVATHLDGLKPWPVVLHGPEREHPPLMFVLVKVTLGLLGTSETAVRAVSLFFGCVLLVAAHELCLELGLSVKRALIVVATLALDPFFIRHATEARQYAMLAALVTLATTRTLRLLRGPLRIPDVAGFAASALAAAYTQYFGLAYGLALLGGIVIGIAPGWKQSSLRQRFGLVALLGAFAVLLTFVAARAVSLGRFYGVGTGGAEAGPPFSVDLLLGFPREFSFLLNRAWSSVIEPTLALIGLLLLSRRLRGVARLLPVGLGIVPCVAATFISAQHFIAPRYLAPSAIWYHVGACFALFAAVDYARRVLARAGRSRLLAPLFGGLVLASVLGMRLSEYPNGFGAGAEDYRAMQRYFVADLAKDTAFVAYNGFFGELLFGKQYPVGTRTIRLEKFRPVRGIDRYLIVELHVNDDDPTLAALVQKYFGLEAQAWRALPLLPVPRSTYQPAVTARILQLPGDRAPESRRKRTRAP